MMDEKTGPIKKIKDEFEFVKDEDIYTEEGIDNYIDDDLISPSEQGFMMGYLYA